MSPLKGRSDLPKSGRRDWPITTLRCRTNSVAIQCRAHGHSSRQSPSLMMWISSGVIEGPVVSEITERRRSTGRAVCCRPALAVRSPPRPLTRSLNRFPRMAPDFARRANQFRFSEIMSSPGNKNISLYPKPKSGLYPLPSRPDQRGARDRHERGTGMRWTRKLRQTSAAEAYGKDVWS
jgi:hypothetical protein